MENKLLSVEGRLELLNEVTKEGLLSLSTTEIRGNDYHVFDNAPTNLREYYQLGFMHGDWTHIVYEGERFQFKETMEKSNQLANSLINDFGIQKGDKVAFSMRNYPEWMFTYIATTSIGAIAVPLNSWWKGDELEYGLVNSEAKLFIADEERLDRVQDILPNLPRIAVRSSNPEHSQIDFNQIIKNSSIDLETEIEILPEDEASIMYTSGSTGHPKGVVLTHRGIIFAPFYWITITTMGKLAEIETGKNTEEDSENSYQTATLLSVPLFHVTGCHAIFLLSIAVGRKTVMMYKWDPEKALDLIEAEKISAFTGVPTMSSEIVEAQRKNPRNIDTLKDLLGGGSARPPEQVRKQKEYLPKTNPGIGYGMTETNALGANNTGEVYVQKPESTGYALPLLMDLKVIDDDGNDLSTNESGEVCIKSASTFKGYWKNQEATDQALTSDGWVKTGDIGYLDDQGFLYINDRKKDLVIRGGENISCIEVESMICEHPSVLEASVFGVPDDRLGEILATYICIREDSNLSEEEISSFLAEKIANFKIPTHYRFQKDKLPRIASGKIAKIDMRKEAVELLKSNGNIK